MYKRLYFYAAEDDYKELLKKLIEYDLTILPMRVGGNTHLDFDKIRMDRGRRLSLKHPDDVRRDRRDNLKFTSATYDVLGWRRGYVYKQHLVGHEIEQTLPFFKKPNPTELDLVKFEDARALRKVWNGLRNWMKKNWTDYYNNGDYFGPEALRLHTEAGYLDVSYDPDRPPDIKTIYVGDN